MQTATLSKSTMIIDQVKSIHKSYGFGNTAKQKLPVVLCHIFFPFWATQIITVATKDYYLHKCQMRQGFK